MKFINKQLAMILKEKGFNKLCFGWYDIENNNDKLILNVKEGTLSYKNLLEYTNDINGIADAPTIDQVLKWLREEKKIHITINALPTLNENFISKQDNMLIYDVRVSWFERGIFNYYDLDEPYFNYEDACIEGIKYVVNNLI